MDFSQVRALAFDVFGTVVDWRSSLIAQFEEHAARHGLRGDWAAIADEWRGAYRPAMQRVRDGERAWAPLDTLHRESLDAILARHGLDSVPEAQRETMVDFWHRLTPWPDAVAGLARLRARAVVSTLSNGNVRLLADMAKHAGLPWDVILSAEMAQHYKPDREVYEMAIRYLGPRPEHVMMVAAHNDDLLYAKRCGMPAAFVARPAEYGRRGNPGNLAPEAHVDIAVTSIVELAERLTP